MSMSLFSSIMFGLSAIGLIGMAFRKKDLYKQIRDGLRSKKELKKQGIDIDEIEK